MTEVEAMEIQRHVEKVLESVDKWFVKRAGYHVKISDVRSVSAKILNEKIKK